MHISLSLCECVSERERERLCTSELPLLLDIIISHDYA